MAVPATITTSLTALQAQIKAATPLQGATRATVRALQLNADQLVADVDAALSGAAGGLDTWRAPTDPTTIISGVLAVSTAATDQLSLSDMRGLVGRVASNLNQL